MGRGLSGLQKTILRMAHDNRVSMKRTDESRGADLYYYEVLAAVWRFDRHPRTDSRGTPAPLRVPEDHAEHVETSDGFRRTPGHQHFSKAAIGAEKYNAATASLSRAVTRLEGRGLVRVMQGARSLWTGVVLTPDGIKFAEGLSVKPPEEARRLNR